MSQGNGHRPSVLITDAGRGNAISFIRSLGRKGWRVIAGDSNPNSLGFRSRYTEERVVYPASDRSPRVFAETLLEEVRVRHVDLVIPITDAAILPLSERRSDFEGVCKLAVPDAAALDVVTNKLKTVELAQRLGVPTPQTRLVHTAAEALEQSRSFAWPIVLKPRASRVYRDQSAIEFYAVSYADSLDSLAEQMKVLEGRCPVLLQEYCEGTGQGVELLLHRGRVLAAFQHRRLREIPVHGGVSSYRESVPLDPAMYDYAARMLGALEWTGLGMVEFKTGQAGPRLMEINGRVWGS